MKILSRPLLIATCLALFPAASHAAERELVDWLRHFLNLIGQEALDYRTLSLDREGSGESEPPRARVKVESPEKFWRLAALIEEKDGAATMSREESAPGQMNRTADFAVRLLPPKPAPSPAAGWWPPDALRALREKLKGSSLVKLARTRVESLEGAGTGVLEIELAAADSLPLVGMVSELGQMPEVPPLTGLTLQYDVSESKLLARFSGPWGSRPGGSTAPPIQTVEERLEAAGAAVTPLPDQAPGIDFVFAIQDPVTAEGLLDSVLPLPAGTVKIVVETGSSPSMHGRIVTP